MKIQQEWDPEIGVQNYIAVRGRLFPPTAALIVPKAIKAKRIKLYQDAIGPRLTRRVLYSLPIGPKIPDGPLAARWAIKILDDLCSTFGVNRDELFAEKSRRRVQNARRAACIEIANVIEWSPGQIATVLSIPERSVVGSLSTESRRRAEVYRTKVRNVLGVGKTRREYVFSIIDAVGKEYGVTRADIIGPRRHKHFLVPRRKAINLVYRRLRDLSSTQIGAIFNRDHTTILHAIKLGWPEDGA